MRMKRWTAFWLGILILAVPLVSCSAKKPSTSDETRTQAQTQQGEESMPLEETVDPNTVPDIPEGTDFGGKMIRILIRRNEKFCQEWGSNEIPDATATELDQQVYLRNELVQQTLNVNFHFTQATVADGNDFNQVVSKAASLDNSFDIISNKEYNSVADLVLGHYINLYDLENLNLSKSYWNQTFISAGTVNGNLYTVVGDVNLSVYMCMFCMFFNIDKCEAQGEGWSAADLFDTVLNGDWTWEELARYVKAADVNSDINAATPLYALYSHSYSHAFDGLLHAFNLQLSMTDPDDGSHSLVAGSAWSKMQQAANKIYELYHDANNPAALDKTGYDPLSPLTGNTEYNLFDAGQALFALEGVSDSQKRKTANLADEYGLLPLPKYDSSQEEYYTGVHDAHNVISVMNGNRNYAAVGAVLELLSAYSYEGVRPYYVETLVKKRYLDDPQSAKVLDLVLDGAKWDFVAIYASRIMNSAENGQSPVTRLWRAGVERNELVTRYAQYEQGWNEAFRAFDSSEYFQKQD